MVDSEYYMDIYKFVKINIGSVIINPEILKLIPNHFKPKKLCKNADAKLPFVIQYVPNWQKTRKMCDKAILENGRTLESVPECYKSQQMFDK